MANPTSNFNWQMPTASDLVTDLPADFEVFGQAVDTSLADLKGGTTGQVLSKTSNTDMDFTWVDTDDTNAIQNAIVDAKGDLIAASAADTPARLAVGNNGETLVADSSTSTGLRWQGDYAAGKSKIINGDFSTWQRGTTFTHTGAAYTADRFQGYSDASQTYTRQAFTAGTAPVAGYEGQYFWRGTKSASGSFISIIQKIEDVRTLANQTMTVSFWAKTDAAQTIYVRPYQNFGSGGSSTVVFSALSATTTTSWARYSFTFAVPSISGKTIGTSSFLAIEAFIAPASTVTMDIWGVQVEAGSVATAFQTATGTIQGELAACQRYLPAILVSSGDIGSGQAYSSTAALVTFAFNSTARVAPTGITVSAAGNFRLRNSTAGLVTPTAIVFGTSTPNSGTLEVTGASGLSAGNATNLVNFASGTIFFTGCEL